MRRAAGRGRTGAPAGSFQGLDAAAQGRLGQVHARGGAGEGEFVGQGDGVAQGAQVTLGRLTCVMNGIHHFASYNELDKRPGQGEQWLRSLRQCRQARGAVMEDGGWKRRNFLLGMGAVGVAGIAGGAADRQHRPRTVPVVPTALSAGALAARRPNVLLLVSDQERGWPICLPASGCGA